MILDFGQSIRRYHIARGNFIWTNGAPGGGTAGQPDTRIYHEGFIVNVGRMMGR